MRLMLALLAKRLGDILEGNLLSGPAGLGVLISLKCVPTVSAGSSKCPPIYRYGHSHMLPLDKYCVPILRYQWGMWVRHFIATGIQPSQPMQCAAVQPNASAVSIC